MSQISTPGSAVQGMLGSLTDQQALQNQQKQQEFQRQMALKDIEMQGKRLDLEREATRARMQAQRQGLQQEQSQFQQQMEFQRQKAQEDRALQQEELALRRQDIEQSMQLARDQMERASRQASLDAQRSLMMERARLQAGAVERQTIRAHNLEARRATMYGAALMDEVRGNWNTTMDVFRGAWREAQDRLQSHNMAIEQGRILGETAGTDLLMVNLIPRDQNDQVVTPGGLSRLSMPVILAASNALEQLERSGVSLDEVDSGDVLQMIDQGVKQGVRGTKHHEAARAIILNAPEEVGGLKSLGITGGFAEGTREAAVTKLAMAYLGLGRLRGAGRGSWVIGDLGLTSEQAEAFWEQGIMPSGLNLDQLARSGLEAEAPVLTKWLNRQMTAGSMGGAEARWRNTVNHAVALLAREDPTGFYHDTVGETGMTVSELVTGILDPKGTGSIEQGDGLMAMLQAADPETKQKVGLALNQVQAFLKSAPTSMPSGMPENASDRMLLTAREQFFNVRKQIAEAAGSFQTAMGFRDPIEIAREMEILYEEMRDLGVDKQSLERLRNEILPGVLDELEYLSDPRWRQPYYDRNLEGPQRGFAQEGGAETGFIGLGQLPEVEDVADYNSKLEARLMSLLDTMTEGLAGVGRANQFAEQVMRESQFSAAEASESFFEQALADITNELGRGLDADFGSLSWDPSAFVGAPSNRWSPDWRPSGVF